MNPHQGQQFKKKREQFTINVRKANREQMIMKRRNIEQSINKQSNMEQKYDEKLIIVDSSLKSFITQALKYDYKSVDIMNLIELMNSPNILEKHRAVIGIKKLTYNLTDKIIQHVQDQNFLKKLIEWSDQNEYLQIKLQVLWIITNLTSISSLISEKIVKFNFLPILFKTLSHSNQVILLQAIWVAGNLAAQNTKYRDQIIQQGGGVVKIIKYLQQKRNNSQISTAIWTLTNLARGNPSPKYDLVKYVVPSMAQVLKANIITNKEILSDCLWTLANLSQGSKVRLTRVQQTGILPKIIKYLFSDNMTIAIPTIRIIGNYTAGNKQQTNQVLKQDFFSIALTLLDKPKWVFVKQLCWAISNITAGTDQQILQFLTRQDLIQKLLQIYPQQNVEVKTQIIWIFTNLQRSGIPDMIEKLYKVIDLIPKIGENLKQKNQRILLDNLNCLYRVLSLSQKCQKNNEQIVNQLQDLFLKSGYGTVLQDLQNHESPKIYTQCVKIFNRFFSVTETSMLDF